MSKFGSKNDAQNLGRKLLKIDQKLTSKISVKNWLKTMVKMGGYKMIKFDAKSWL
jgi:hypothetical protein